MMRIRQEEEPELLGVRLLVWPQDPRDPIRHPLGSSQNRPIRDPWLLKAAQLRILPFVIARYWAVFDVICGHHFTIHTPNEGLRCWVEVCNNGDRCWE